MENSGWGVYCESDSFELMVNDRLGCCMKTIAWIKQKHPKNIADKKFHTILLLMSFFILFWFGTLGGFSTRVPCVFKLEDQGDL